METLISDPYNSESKVEFRMYLLGRGNQTYIIYTIQIICVTIICNSFDQDDSMSI